jgi:hypothetical protein
MPNPSRRLGRAYLTRKEKPLFTFAIIADTHMRPEAGDESSPWIVNTYANGRARWVIHRINQANPDFVIHMGDVVHPFPTLSTFGPACEASLEAMRAFESPYYVLPGNHDVGDKMNPMAPADLVSEFGIQSYVKYFGKPHQSFDHKGVHFVLINVQVLNSGLPSEAPHNAWLEADLEANKGKRVWLFTHYPPYVTFPDEPSNYDNVDEPGRSWLLGLVEKYDIEAVFAGHVHNFFYQRHGHAEIYNLLATSFVRQDYAEMFRIEAVHEYGRDDAEKLGWCVVDVYESAHVARIHRSGGRMLGPGETLLPAKPCLKQYHVKDALRSPLGLHLRHPWAEVTDLPYNGPMDEFHRKQARNDYTLLGLWEMGARKLRVPLSDLLDARVRERMRALRFIGHDFTVFSFGLPSGAALETLTQYADLLAVLEIVLSWREAPALIPKLAALKKAVPVPLHLANIESSAGKKHVGSKFSHFVSYGFSKDSRGQVEEFLKAPGARDAADGFVFRINPGEDLWAEIAAIDRLATAQGVRAIATVRLASENPAAYPADDRAIADRVALAMTAAAAMENGGAFLDTMVDLDRGYFPRHGLYDRRYNRRLASLVFGHLVSVLNEHEGPVRCGAHGEGFADFALGGRPCRLFVGARPEGAGAWIDLASGEILDRAPEAPPAPVLRLG